MTRFTYTMMALAVLGLTLPGIGTRGPIDDSPVAMNHAPVPLHGQGPNGDPMSLAAAPPTTSSLREPETFGAGTH